MSNLRTSIIHVIRLAFIILILISIQTNPFAITKKQTVASKASTALSTPKDIYITEFNYQKDLEEYGEITFLFDAVVTWPTIPNATSYDIRTNEGIIKTIKASSTPIQKATIPIRIPDWGLDERLLIELSVKAKANKRESNWGFLVGLSQQSARIQKDVDDQAKPVQFPILESEQNYRYCFDRKAPENYRQSIRNIISTWNSSVPKLKLKESCDGYHVGFIVKKLDHLGVATHEIDHCNHVCYSKYSIIKIHHKEKIKTEELTRTVIHELGHAFGLGHQPDMVNSIMNYNLKINQLTTMDIKHLDEIYSKN